MIVDSHQHFWSLDAPWFDWPTPDLAAIYRDYAPADLAPEIEAAGVSGTVLVQAAPHLAETHYLLDIAQRTPFVGAVVGWVDLERSDQVDELNRLAEHPKFRGIRPMLQAIPDTEWMLRPDLEPCLTAAEELGLTFDALVKPPHLEALAAFADRYPNLPIVVDHGAKPEIARGADGFRDWAPQIAALARRPQVFCKLSGLLTEAGDRTADDDLRPFAEHLIETFGPERLMWGSDWPVLDLAAPYAQWFATVQRFVAPLSDGEQSSILGETARRFYRF
ncbi:amidohydrolase family protein [Microvirga sp. GCM10011540]|uniref:amidohydrolase family protein n=1 Tax=Microvirga sp. GCM10011540 TaxID=3317338 RepID=UPI003609BB51